MSGSPRLLRALGIRAGSLVWGVLAWVRREGAHIHPVGRAAPGRSWGCQARVGLLGSPCFRGFRVLAACPLLCGQLDGREAHVPRVSPGALPLQTPVK